MAMRSGKCTNFGNCPVADSKQIVQIPEGTDLLCPNCVRQLTEVGDGPKYRVNPIVWVAAVLLVFVGGVIWWIRRPPPPLPPPSAILRLHGSNTIGAKLAPALAAEFLRQQGAKDVKTITGKNDESAVQGVLPDDSAVKTIEIQAHGSATAFSDLASDKCDIGMASRKIKTDEIRSLASLGDMSSPASEHVLGLDGIAVIVNPGNSVQSLTKDQIAQIFAGSVTNWTQVLGTPGPIKVYARDDKSGTYDTFKTLGSRSLVSGATRLEDSSALSDAVAGDASGIGFIGLPYIRNAKAVALSETGTKPLMPNRITVATEDYALSRRLYLYTPSNPQNPYTRKFIQFALSKAGQDVVGASGFVAQNVEAQKVTVAPGAPNEYKQLSSGADRLTLDFRFRTGSSDLDNKAHVDIERVVTFLSDLKYSGNNVLLFGFADSRGGRQLNMNLSNQRAKAVSEQFQTRGVSPGVVEGFGPDLPVASNDTEDGREKNRRVEIWLKK